jgi:hypothetical protein
MIICSQGQQDVFKSCLESKGPEYTGKASQGPIPS